MSKISVVIGIFLILLGVASYIGTGGVSITALIPVLFGALFVGLGYIGNQKKKSQKPAMYGALFVAILGIGGSFGGLLKLLRWLGGGEAGPSAAVVAQSLMAIACMIFLVIGIGAILRGVNE